MKYKKYTINWNGHELEFLNKEDHERSNDLNIRINDSDTKIYTFNMNIESCDCISKDKYDPDVYKYIFIDNDKECSIYLFKNEKEIRSFINNCFLVNGNFINRFCLFLFEDKKQVELKLKIGITIDFK